MRVYDAIFRGLESIGVDAAFGGAGENAAGAMIALKHSTQDPPGHDPPRAGGGFHGLRLRHVHQQARRLLRHGRARRLQPVLRACRGDVRLLSGARHIGLRLARVERQGLAQRDLGAEPHARLAQACSRPRPRAAGCSPTSTRRWMSLEKAVNLAFEGRPGPVHIHVPENLTHHGVEVTNYRDLRLKVAPVLPDRRRGCRDRRLPGRRLRQEQEGRGAGRLWRHS